MASRNRSRSAGLVCLVLLFAAVSWLLSYHLPELFGSFSSKTQALENTTTVSFLDVGQGDCTLIQSGSDAVLIDGGPTDAAETVVADLQEAGVSHLTAVIATHPHEDHIGGLPAVLEAIPTDTVYLSDEGSTSRVYEKFLDAVDESGADAVFPDIGDRIALDSGAVLTNLAPGAHSSKTYGKKHCNSWSLVFRLDANGHSALFTGDTTKSVERDMVSRGEPLSCDILKVAHHGSDTSSCEEFLEQAAPQYAVISCAETNSYGLPDPNVLQRLRQFDISVLTTAAEGTITVSLTQDNGLVFS